MQSEEQARSMRLQFEVKKILKKFNLNLLTDFSRLRKVKPNYRGNSHAQATDIGNITRQPKTFGRNKEIRSNYRGHKNRWHKRNPKVFTFFNEVSSNRP